MDEPTAQPEPTPRLEPTPQDHLALYLETELEDMQADWKLLISQSPACPSWTWDQVAEALLSLTANPVEELVVRGGLSGLVKQARFKPADLVLEELIRLVRASHDVILQRRASEMLEAEMP